MKFYNEDFFSESFQWIWSHLLKESLIESFIFLYSVCKSTNWNEQAQWKFSETSQNIRLFTKDL